MNQPYFEVFYPKENMKSINTARGVTYVNPALLEQKE